MLAVPAALPLAAFDDLRHVGPTREELIRLPEATYIDCPKLERARKLRISCMDAVLMAAFKDRQP